MKSSAFKKIVANLPLEKLIVFEQGRQPNIDETVKDSKAAVLSIFIRTEEEDGSDGKKRRF